MTMTKEELRDYFADFTEDIRAIFKDREITPVYMACDDGAVGHIHISGYDHPIRVLMNNDEGSSEVCIPKQEYSEQFMDIVKAFVHG